MVSSVDTHGCWEASHFPANKVMYLNAPWPCCRIDLLKVGEFEDQLTTIAFLRRQVQRNLEGIGWLIAFDRSKRLREQLFVKRSPRFRSYQQVRRPDAYPTVRLRVRDMNFHRHEPDGPSGKPGVCLPPISLPRPSTRTVMLGKRCHRNHGRLPAMPAKKHRNARANAA